MGIVFRQSAKNLIVVGLGALLGALIVWLSTKYITKQEYGFLTNFVNYAITLAQILLFGLNNSLMVYIHRYPDDNRKRRALITLCLLLPLVFVAVFTAIYFLAKEPILQHFQPGDIPFMRRYYVWLPPFVVFFIYMVILEQYLGSQMKVAASAFMREVLLRLLGIGLIVLVAYQFIGFHELFIGNILIYLVPIFAFLFMASRTQGFRISFQPGGLSNSEYREILSFSWYHFLFTVASLLMVTLDQMLLPLYDHNGFESVAVYRVAAFFISFLMMPLKALVPASFPGLARAFTDNDMLKARDIFTRSSVNIFIATVFIAVVLCCNVSSLITIMNKSYADVVPVFFILCFGVLCNVATGMNDQVLSIANYYKFNFYLSLILMLVLFVMMKTFIPIYGIYGAAWSTTAGLLISNAVKYVFIWRKLGMQSFTSGTALTLVAGAVAFCAGYFFPHFFDVARHMYVRTFGDVIIRSAVIGIVYMAMLFWLKPSQDLVEYISQVKRNKRLF